MDIVSIISTTITTDMVVLRIFLLEETQPYTVRSESRCALQLR